MLRTNAHTSHLCRMATGDKFGLWDFAPSPEEQKEQVAFVGWQWAAQTRTRTRTPLESDWQLKSCDLLTLRTNTYAANRLCRMATDNKYGLRDFAPSPEEQHKRVAFAGWQRATRVSIRSKEWWTAATVKWADAPLFPWCWPVWSTKFCVHFTSILHEWDVGLNGI